MTRFTISRINTTQGIFQICGASLGEKIIINKLLMMGTDGWFALDLQQDIVKTLIAEITPALLKHLQTD